MSGGAATVLVTGSERRSSLALAAAIAVEIGASTGAPFRGGGEAVAAPGGAMGRDGTSRITGGA